MKITELALAIAKTAYLLLVLQCGGVHGVMQDGKPDPVDDPLKSLSHALEESRRLRENLRYMPAAIGMSSPPAQESAEQAEEVLAASV